MTYLVEILLPLTERAREDIAHVRAELVAKFGGVTMHVNAPAEGLWADDGDVEQDRIVVIEVMTHQIDRNWWSSYKTDLEARLDQKEILIRASKAERL